MTKRETIAAMAMQGQLGNAEWIQYIGAMCNEDGSCPIHRLISHSVEYADALITELDRTAPKCPKCEEGGTGSLCARHVTYGAVVKESLKPEHHIPDARKMVPGDDGWIDHVPGDVMPVGGLIRVDLLFRNGRIFKDEIAGDWSYSGGNDKGYDIIKWRPAR